MSPITVDDAPEHMICPLTLSVMVNPMIDTISGQSFERDDLLLWLYFGPGTNPLTRAPLHPSQLVDNKNLQKEITEWKASNGIYEEPEEEEESSEFFVENIEKKAAKHTGKIRNQTQAKKYAKQKGNRLMELATRVIKNRDDRVKAFMFRRGAQA
jgi:hypothetical protein